MTDYENFRIYLEKVKDIFLYAVGPSIFVPVIAYFSKILPPNPEFTNILSSLFVVLISVVIYANYSKKSLKRRARIISAAFWALCFIVVIYTILFQLFVFSPEGYKNQIVTGCGYKSEFILGTKDKGLSLDYQCPGEPELILHKFNYDPRNIWTPLSLVSINTLLFVTWMSMLALITTIITTFLCGFKFETK